MKKNLLRITLVSCLLITLLSFGGPAFAQDEPEPIEDVEETTTDESETELEDDEEEYCKYLDKDTMKLIFKHNEGIRKNMWKDINER